MKSTFAKKAANFYSNLAFPSKLPKKVDVMNPYQRPEVRGYLDIFLKKFYADRDNRTFVFGINPGRFGSGLTGVTFTDPVALNDFCGIPNTLPRIRERSSEFIYSFIEKYGGTEKFYKDFFLTAISPLGFTLGGINYNYYDSPALLKISKPFILETLRMQMNFGANRNAAILIGTGKNQKFFTDVNNEYGFFKKLYAVEHPRFIMQYRRRHLSKYLKKYQDVFSKALAQ